MSMSLKDTLLAYGEWLDGEKLLVSPDADVTRGDASLEDLANEFINQWTGVPLPTTDERIQQIVDQVGEAQLTEFMDTWESAPMGGTARVELDSTMGAPVRVRLWKGEALVYQGVLENVKKMCRECGTSHTPYKNPHKSK